METQAVERPTFIVLMGHHLQTEAAISLLGAKPFSANNNGVFGLEPKTVIIDAGNTRCQAITTYGADLVAFLEDFTKDSKTLTLINIGYKLEELHGRIKQPVNTSAVIAFQAERLIRNMLGLPRQTESAERQLFSANFTDDEADAINGKLRQCFPKPLEWRSSSAPPLELVERQSKEPAKAIQDAGREIVNGNAALSSENVGAEAAGPVRRGTGYIISLITSLGHSRQARAQQG